MQIDKLQLAPMEGVVDWVMRDVLTRIGGIDHCVTEFIRVVDRVYPDHVFYKYCPELKTHSKTLSGTPIFIQLLGGQPEPLAENALRAVSLGAIGVDLNFGCPAKTVNRHDGGATLLQYPTRIFNIVSAVRKAVPSSVPVTAKIRLGFDNPNMCIEIAKAVEEANASWITVHCRTKTDAYKPPAFWEWIPRIKETIKLKVVANGDIWNVNDFNQCKKITGCTDFMIGRGALRDPYLFQKIKSQSKQNTPWDEIKPLIPKFFEASTVYRNEQFAVSRTKQWLRSIASQSAEAQDVFNSVKVILKPKEFEARLHQL